MDRGGAWPENGVGGKRRAPMPAWELLGEAGLASARQRTHHCARPVRLRGSTRLVSTTTGEVRPIYSSSDEIDGITSVPCGNRRAAVCDSCSATYKRDAWGLITAGLAGGKGIPASVGDHPCTFATLTAPSFGPVHGMRQKGLCRARRDHPVCPHGRPLWCAKRHHHGDRDLGEPLCVDCYDYTAHVVWQWYAPELWRRFTIALQRDLARPAGLDGRVVSRGVQDLLLQGRRVPGSRRDPRARADPPRWAGGPRRPPASAGTVDSRSRGLRQGRGRPGERLVRSSPRRNRLSAPMGRPGRYPCHHWGGRPRWSWRGGRASGAGGFLPGEVSDQGHGGLRPPRARPERCARARYRRQPARRTDHCRRGTDRL